jgi:low affinity Fe/Cu permease
LSGGDLRPGVPLSIGVCCGGGRRIVVKVQMSGVDDLMGIAKRFEHFTTGCARFAGRPAMLVICLVLALIGIAAYVSGSDHFINGANLSISIVTLLLLPILQATQNRDGAAVQAKLDELIKANADARDALIGLERKGEDQIEQLRRNQVESRPSE